MLQFFDTLTDDSGNALLGATVFVQNYPSLTNAAIYSSNGTANPIATATVAADITGQVSFYIPDGSYQLTYSYQSHVYKVRVPVALFDPMAEVVLADTGSANAYAINNIALPGQLYTGLRVTAKIANTNTGAATLNINGTGNQPITTPSIGALPGGVLTASGIYSFIWDGTEWQMQVAAPGPPVFARTQPEITASVVPLNTGYQQLNILRYYSGSGTYDTALASAILVAAAAGAPVYFPGGTYPVAGSIANLHTTPQSGQGQITRSGNTFYVGIQPGQTNNLYVGTGGSNSNDGLTAALPMLTLQTAVTALSNYGPVLGGTWILTLAAGTYTGANASSTFPAGLQALNAVQVNGPTGALPFTPTAIIDGSTATNGTWGLVLNGQNNVTVNNILFQNWTNGNGATQWGATVAQTFSQIFWNNVYTNNCDWNLKGQEGRIYCAGGVQLGGYNGCSSISGSTHTFGYGASLQAPAGVAITGASGTGTQATITFAAQASAPIVGGWFSVRGISPAGYNGVYQVVSSSTTSITYNNATTGAYVSGGLLSYNHGCTGYGPFIANASISGFLVQENATGHFDYSTIDNCAIGSDIVCSSRVNFNFSNLLNNITCGFRTRMDANVNNNGIVFSGNATQFLQYSFGAEFARQGGFTSITCQPINTVAATPLTGSTSLTALMTFANWLAAGTFTDSTKTERIRGAGKITGVAGTKTITIVTSLGTMGTFVIPATWGGAGATPFVFEFMFMARSSANSQDFYGVLVVDQSTGNPGGNVVITGSTAFNFASGAAQTLTINGQLGNAADTLALNMAEPGWETG